MRIKNILAQIQKHKTCSRAQLYNYIKILAIKPIGARQRPQLYPADTAERVLTHLGILDATPKPPRLASLAQLRKERKAA